MRVRRAQHGRMGLARPHDVVEIAAAAGQEPPVFDASDRLSDAELPHRGTLALRYRLKIGSREDGVQFVKVGRAACPLIQPGSEKDGLLRLALLHFALLGLDRLFRCGVDPPGLETDGVFRRDCGRRNLSQYATRNAAM